MFLRDMFMKLSENEMMNSAAQHYGHKLGAQHIVAGRNLEETIESIRDLNAKGITCTVAHLGELVQDEAVATEAKNQILHIIEAIEQQKLQAHISLKPSQLGLDIDIDLCYDHLREIVERAAQAELFVNIDTENYERLSITLDMVEELTKSFDNVGTVIQAYLLRAQQDIERFKHLRLRIVKGAYQESEAVAHHDPLEIDLNFIELIEYHLLHGTFTSIATHDDAIISHVKRFVKEHEISHDKFEFQMLYGFRKDRQLALAQEGFNFCVYVPFGEQWYGYFMRSLAERPQNIHLVTKQVFNKKTNTLLAVAAGAFFIGRITKKRN